VISLTDEIERQVHFIVAPAFDPEDKTGVNNTWQYNRAPEGFLFLLESIQVSTSQEAGHGKDGICALYDGHEYTHWNQFPGVQSNELLCRMEHNVYILSNGFNLHGWPCKEYTLGIRSISQSSSYKICAVIWYYLKKASRMELLEYAIKHPRNQDMFKRALRGQTIEPTEA